MADKRIGDRGLHPYVFVKSNTSIENSKQRYYPKLSSKLTNPATSLKTYCIILKIFLNKKNSCITLLFHENKFITNFKEKAELFNFFPKPMHSIEQQQCFTQ